MSDFNATYPEYAATVRLDTLRAGCYGNPHGIREYAQARGCAVRGSPAARSSRPDVEAFLDFAERGYRDRWPGMAGLSPRHAC